MTTELKVVFKCERTSCGHTEESSVGTVLGFASKPKHPAGWGMRNEKWFCPICTKGYDTEYSKWFREFMVRK